MAAFAARNRVPPPLLAPRRLPAGLASMCILGRRARRLDALWSFYYSSPYNNHPASLMGVWDS